VILVLGNKTVVEREKHKTYIHRTLTKFTLIIQASTYLGHKLSAVYNNSIIGTINEDTGTESGRDNNHNSLCSISSPSTEGPDAGPKRQTWRDGSAEVDHDPSTRTTSRIQDRRALTILRRRRRQDG